jgi:hypothetical protein
LIYVNLGKYGLDKYTALHVESGVRFFLFSFLGSQILVLLPHHWSTLVPVHQHTPFIAVLANLAGDPLYRHTDCDWPFTQIGGSSNCFEGKYMLYSDLD